MRHTLNKNPGVPLPAEGLRERVRFEGMQGSRVVTEDDPIWQTIEDYDAGQLFISTECIPDLLNNPDPDAIMVLQALYRLGAFD